MITEANAVHLRTAITAQILGYGAIWNIFYGDCGNDLGSGCNFGFLKNTTSTQFHSNGSGVYTYYFPDEARLTLTQTVKADNPINITFSGHAKGLIRITSNSSVLVDGQLNNPRGLTEINATNGDIVNGALGTLTAEDMSLNAGGRVGSSLVPIVAAITSPDTLSATSGSQGIYIKLSTGAGLGTIRAGSAGNWGDIVISASGDITRSSGSPVVSGRNITLITDSGGVGTMARPLVISTHPTSTASGVVFDGLIRAKAIQDIVLVQPTGNVYVDAPCSDGSTTCEESARVPGIDSFAGSVYLEATAGSIYSARDLTSASILSEDQTREIWARLKLTGADAEANQNLQVTYFEGQVVRYYDEYWRLRANGEVVGDAYVLDDASIILYRSRAAAALGRSPSDLEVKGYAAYLYRSVEAFFDNEALPADTALCPAPDLTNRTCLLAVDAPLTGTSLTPLGTNWRTQAPFVTFDASFAYTASTDIATALKEDGIWDENELRFAIDLTALQAGSGTPVGVTAPNVSGFNVTLVAGGRIGKPAAPVEATKDEIINGLLSDEQISAIALATAPGDITLLGRNTVTGAVAPFSLVPSTNSYQLPVDTELVSIRVKQFAPFFIASTGTFNATTTTGVIYVQSTISDLHVGAVNAGGEVSLTTPRSILSAGTAAVQVTTPGDLRMLAGTGDLVGAVGSPAPTPFVVSVGGTITSVIAGGDLSIEDRNGDLVFDRVFAEGDAWLESVNGAITQRTAGTGITGDSIDLAAATLIGSEDVVVQILVSDGASGTLRAVAPSGIYIRSVSSMIVAFADSEHGDILLDVGGDALIDYIRAPEGLVSLFADDGIFDHRAPASGLPTNIDADAAVINARTGIGTPTNALGTRINRLESRTAEGAVWVAQVGHLVIGNITDQEGVFSDGTGNILVIGTIEIIEPIRTSGDNILVQATGSVIFGPAGAIDGEVGTPIIVIIAGSAGGPGFVTMHPTSYVDAVGGTILVDATRDITLSLLNTTGGIDVSTPGGSIFDADTAGAGDNVDVVATNIVLFASGSIGTFDNDLDVNESGAIDATAFSGSIYLTESVGAFDARLITAAVDIRITTPDTTADGEDIRLDETIDTIAAGGTVTLRAGDDIFSVGTIAAGAQITMLTDYGDADADGTESVIGGSISAPLIEIFGEADDDDITYTPHTIVGHTEIWGGAGDDEIFIDQVLLGNPNPTIDLAHKLHAGGTGPGSLVTGNEATRARNMINVDGQGGQDYTRVDLNGAAGSDYIVNVVDSGGAGDAADVLTINGLDTAADVFLIRAKYYDLGSPVFDDSADFRSPAFVARLQPSGGGAYADTYERVNYDRTINVLRINGHGGEDRFYADDTSAIMTIDGGEGDDYFQIGQLFGSPRVSAGECTPGLLADPCAWSANQNGLGDDELLTTPGTVAPDDELRTLQTTRGFLSRGISFPAVVYGGNGDDEFVVYSNKALLKLFGEANNDSFLVRAFLLKDTGGVAGDATEVNGGSGDDRIEYNINAPLSIDGGDGVDTIIVVGTEGPDSFVITSDAIFGAGLAITYVGGRARRHRRHGGRRHVLRALDEPERGHDDHRRPRLRHRQRRRRCHRAHRGALGRGRQRRHQPLPGQRGSALPRQLRAGDQAQRSDG